MATTNDKRKRKLSFSGTTISVRSDCKRKKLDPIIFFPTREMFLQTMVKQQFSLPYPIIKHMWENPSSAKVFQKLVQSCKMFFIKNPLIVLPEWYCSYKKGKWQIDVDSIRASKMIWLSEELSAISNVPCTLSGALEKVVKCDIEYLSLSRLTCTTTELSFIGSKSTSVTLNSVTVIDENGVTAPLEKLFGIFKYVKFFYSLHSPSHLITPNTVSELIKMEHFATIDYFCVHKVPELFDIDAFYNHLKSLGKKESVQLRFVSQLSVPYKKRLQEIRDSIGEDIKFFKIRFDGMVS